MTRKYNALKSCILLLPLLFVCLSSIGQEHFSYRFNSRNGLLSNNVRIINTDNNGYVWIPTDKGLTKFNGQDFVHFTTKNGLHTNDVFSTFSIDNTNWILDQTHTISYIKNDSVGVLEISEKTLVNDAFRKRIPTQGHRVITNRDNSTIIYFDEDTCHSIKVNKHLYSAPTLKMKVADKRLTSFSTASFCEIFANENFFIFSFDSTLLIHDYATGHTEEIQFDVYTSREFHNRYCNIYPTIYANYCVFSPYNSSMLYAVHLKNFKVKRLDLKAIHKEYTGTLFHIVDSNKLKITTKDNFYIEIDDSLGITDTFHWQGNSNSFGINKDNSGNYWVSTSRGLYLRPFHFTNYKHISAPFAKAKILNIFKNENYLFLFDKQSNMYVTDHHFNLIKTEALPFIHKSYPEITKYWFLDDHKGGYYIASAHGTYYLNSKLEISPVPQYFAHRSLKDYYFDKSWNSLVVSSNTGFLMSTDKTLEIHEFLYALARIRILHTNKHEKKLWCTNDLGRIIIVSEDFQIEKDTTINKAISFSTIIDGQLIFYADGDGIYSMDSSLKSYKLLIEDDNFNYYAKSKDGMWVANNNYIMHINNNLAKDKIYLNTKGLLYNEVYNISECGDTTFLLCDKGIIMLPSSPNYYDTNFLSTLHVSSVEIGSVTYHLNLTDSTFSKTYSNNNYTFTLSCNSTSFLGEISYYYSLGSDNKKWILAKNGIISYAYLKPGTYKIQIKACVNNTDICTRKKQFIITIRPKWWQSLFFKSSIIFIFIAIIAYAVYLRFKAVKHRAELQTQLDRKVSELELTALQSQMNPHFIFNTLTSIQSFINTQSTYDADQLLQKFSLLVRRYLEFARSKKVSIKQELKTLKLYTGIEQLRFSYKFKVSYIVRNTSSKSLEKIFIPPILIQPIVENAINHGLYHLKNKTGKLRIAFIINNEQIKIIIDDNGVGKTVAKKLRNKLFPSIGNNLIDDRISILNDSGLATISLETIDKYDNNEQPIGVRIIITIQNNTL